MRTILTAMALTARRLARLTRFGIFAFIAMVSGVILSVQKNDSTLNHSVLLDFETSTASADTPDSGTGSSDSGSGDSSDSGDSGDSGSGDCGSGDSGSGDSGDGCSGDGCF
jgi:hypothetical protein